MLHGCRWHDSCLGSRRAEVDSGRGIATPVVFAGRRRRVDRGGHLPGGRLLSRRCRPGARRSHWWSRSTLLCARPDRRSVAVVAAMGALALWWLIRALAQGRPGAFLPLGASIDRFLGCAFLATRRLDGKYRVLATQLVVAVGAVSAAAGLLATTARWYPLAMPAQNLWRLSTTLTYSNAAGALLAVALLVGLGLDQRAPTTRLMVCLCAAGLVATQSRAAVLGALVGVVVVPVAQLRRSAVTVGLGDPRRPGRGGHVERTEWRNHWRPSAVVVALVLAVALTPARRRRRLLDHEAPNVGDRRQEEGGLSGRARGGDPRGRRRRRSGVTGADRATGGARQQRGPRPRVVGRVRPVAVVAGRRRRPRSDACTSRPRTGTSPTSPTTSTSRCSPTAGCRRRPVGAHRCLRRASRASSGCRHVVRGGGAVGIRRRGSARFRLAPGVTGARRWLGGGVGGEIGRHGPGGRGSTRPSPGGGPRCVAHEPGPVTAGDLRTRRSSGGSRLEIMSTARRAQSGGARDATDPSGQDRAREHLHGQVDVGVARQLPELLGPDQQTADVARCGVRRPAGGAGPRRRVPGATPSSVPITSTQLSPKRSSKASR